MSIAVFGVNHRTAPLEVRERFAHAAREVPGSLERVLAAGARGGVLLSTCNRTEFYLTEPGDTAPETVWALLAERLVERRGAREYGYAHRDRDAVRHLYRVSSGLDSMLLGESQIQGQVREAWEISKGQAGPVLHRLFQSALLVGARVRSETGLGMGAPRFRRPSASSARRSSASGPGTAGWPWCRHSRRSATGWSRCARRSWSARCAGLHI